ncbi:MAG: hypothetical protein WCF17_21755 [Terracidiphilus sp.]
MRAAGGRNWAGFAVVLAAAALAVAPLLVRGPSCGHDFDFHLVSWMDALASWRHGILYPHWTPSPNFGAGEARFVFYPPLTWMLGAALGSALPWTLVPAALTFLLLAGTGLATRALARQALPGGAATLAGCVAIFSSYPLFCAYERAAYGELTGGFWIPLLLLYILRDRDPSAPLRVRWLDGAAAPLALALAGCWLSNAPLGVMASYLLAAMALTLAALEKSWAPVLRAAQAAVLGFGLGAIYLVPAAVEQHWVEIGRVIDDPGSMIEGSWLFARHRSPDLAGHDVVLLQVSIIAVTMVALALAGLIVSWRRGTLPGGRRWWIPLALIPVAVLFLQLPLSLPIWNLLPRLRFLQFPWRWLVVLEAPMAILLAAAVRPRESARRWWWVTVAAVCAAIFLGATANAEISNFQVCDEEDNVPAMVSAYRSGAGFDGYDEYAPLGSDESSAAKGLPAGCLVSDPTTELGAVDPDSQLLEWSPDQKSCAATFSFDSTGADSENWRIRGVAPQAGFLILRLRRYPAWDVKVNGRPAASGPARADGMIVVPISSGGFNVSADWTTTPDERLGPIISLVALLLVTGVCVLERRRSRAQVS